MSNRKVTENLGKVTAYRYAQSAEPPYTGTEEEFMEMLANLPEYANRAEDAAGAAHESEDAAAAYADQAYSGTPDGYRELVNDVAVLGARVDQFEHLDEGSTTGDAELMDIRIGADGTEYESAGGAVRQQFSDLKSAISQIRPGLSNRAKIALLDCFAHVAWIDDQGQTYYDELEDALNAVDVFSITLDTYSLAFTTIGSTHQLIATTVPSDGEITWVTSDASVATVSDDGLVTTVGYGSANIIAASGSVLVTCAVLVSEILVTSIDAVYTQSGAVYETDLLNSLKPDLVVTAHWSDSSQTVVPSADYSLSGTLTTGTSVITVSYGGQTADFNVTVTAVVLDHISAVFSPGSAAIYEGDALDTLKQYLLVTAYYNNGTSEVVTDYTLSGTLVEGTNTITVSYMNETTTFTVVAISHVLYKLENRSFDGTQAAIDTGVKLVEQDRTFTMLIDFTENMDFTVSEKVAATLAWFGSGCSISDYKTTNASNVIQDVNLMQGKYTTRQAKTSAGHRRIMVALSHTVDVPGYNVAVSYDGVIQTAYADTRSNYSFVASDANMVYASNNAGTESFKGTINEFIVYDYAYTQAELEAYVTRNV